MDNYPPGAAHDPNAPYNEEPCPDIDVTVRATLVKDTVLTGRYEHRVADYFSDQQKAPIELIRVLEEIVRQLCVTVTAATLTGIYPVCSTIARDGNKKV